MPLGLSIGELKQLPVLDLRLTTIRAGLITIQADLTTIQVDLITIRAGIVTITGGITTIRAISVAFIPTGTASASVTDGRTIMAMDILRITTGRTITVRTRLTAITAMAKSGLR